MRATIPLKTDGDVRKNDRSSRCAICSSHWRTGWVAVRVWCLISFAYGCQSLATSVLAVVIEQKSLEVPDALAILKERNHPVLTDLKNVSESRGRDGRCSTAAFDVVGMKVSQVRMAKYGAKRQEIGVAVQHNSAVDPSHGLQNCAWDIEHSLLMQQVVELVLRTSDRMVAT